MSTLKKEVGERAYRWLVRENTRDAYERRWWVRQRVLWANDWLPWWFKRLKELSR